MYKIITFIIPLIFRLLIQGKRAFRLSGKPAIDLLENSYYLFEAGKLGIVANVILGNVVQLRKGDEVHNILNCGTDLDGRGSMRIAADKVYCYSVLEKLGISIPKYKVFRRGDYKNALAFKRQLNDAIVIKPARGTSDSSGVFIKPEGVFSIFFAVNYAGSFSREIIVEEYIEGVNYRLLFCKGKFLGASSRIPARLLCNGVNTVEELVGIANQGRRKVGDILPYERSSRPILYETKISKQLKKAIRKLGLRLGSIPAKGTVIQVQDICHWLYGGEYYDVTDEISPLLIEKCREAVNALGIKLAGVDVISQDLKNAEQGNYIINEINTTPAMLIHYEVQNQEKMRPVVNEILKIMFATEKRETGHREGIELAQEC